jgi:tetratricopeptide (TPR) repeat protein
MIALFNRFAELWKWITANWEWSIGTAIFSAVIAYLGYQLNRRTRGGTYSKQLCEGHKIRKEAEKLLEHEAERSEEPGDCLNSFLNARDSYKAACAFARTRKEYVEAKLYLAICEKQINRVTGEWNLKIHDMLIESARKKGRKCLVESVLEACEEYRNRYAADTKQTVYLEMVSHLYDLAGGHEKRAKRRAQIAFEAGGWFFDKSQFDKARRQLERCQDISPKLKGLHFKKAEVNFADGRYEDALTDIQRHLSVQPDDREAETLRQKILEKIRNPTTPRPSSVRKKTRRTRFKPETALST